MQQNRTNKELAQSIFVALNSRNLATLEQYLSENARFDFPGVGTIEGRKKVVVFLKVLFRQYPRLVFAVEDIIAEGGQACAVWTNQGEDKKGNAYQNRGITLVRFSEGKIIFISDYFKDTSFVA